MEGLSTYVDMCSVEKQNKYILCKAYEIFFP
jgi:hypothetical protein